MEDDFTTLISDQGYVTSAQARALGRSPLQLARLVAEGVLVRPLQGVYVRPGDRPVVTHARAIRGYLSSNRFAVATMQSALAVLGAPLYATPLARVHVALPGACSHIRQGVHIHVRRDGDAVVDHDGTAMVGPALSALLVAGSYGTPAGLVCLDWLLHNRLASREEVSAIVGSGRIRRGLIAARDAAAAADPRSESPGETLTRHALLPLGLPVRAQAHLGGPGQGYTVDLLVDERVVVEYDGEDKYADDQAQLVVLREKEREDWIREQGYGVVRVGKKRLRYPATLRATVWREVIRTRARAFAA